MKNSLLLGVAAAFALTPLVITPALSQSSSGGTVIHNNSENNQTKSYTEGNPPVRGSDASSKTQAGSGSTIIHNNSENNASASYTEGNPPVRGSGTSASPEAKAAASETVTHVNPNAGQQ